MEIYQRKLTEEQIKEIEEKVKKIQKVITEWKADTWTDNLSYECMSKIADILAESEE